MSGEKWFVVERKGGERETEEVKGGGQRKGRMCACISVTAELVGSRNG